MKIITTAMILTLFVSCNQHKDTSEKSLSKNTFAAEKDTLSPEKVPQTIDEIKKEFTAINEKLLSEKLDSTGFTYSCEEIEGKADFYNEQQSLRMVKHFFADSHFSSVTNYYLKNNMVFFIFKEETVWQFDGGTPEKPITKDSISQQRIYLKNGKTIQCLEKNFIIRSAGKNVDPETVPNTEENCDAKELMNLYRKILKNKDRKDKTLCL
jgi:hypothetical protein